MADPLTVALGTVAAIVVVGIREAVSWARTPPLRPRDATPPPPARLPTIPDADLEALRGRLTAAEQRTAAIEDRVEANEARAQGFRERVIAKLARIFERLKIKEDDDGDRGSR